MCPDNRHRGGVYEGEEMLGSHPPQREAHGGEEDVSEALQLLPAVPRSNSPSYPVTWAASAAALFHFSQSVRVHL